MVDDRRGSPSSRCAGTRAFRQTRVVSQVKLPFGKQPFSVAADGSHCWAVNESGVFRVGAGSVTWSRLPPLGPSAFAGVAAAGGKAWVTIAGRNALLSVR